MAGVTIEPIGRQPVRPADAGQMAMVQPRVVQLRARHTGCHRGETTYRLNVFYRSKWVISRCPIPVEVEARPHRAHRGDSGLASLAIPVSRL